MPSIQLLLEELSDTTVAQRVEKQHDDTRSEYRLRSNQVVDYQDYERAIGEYVVYHSSRCIAVGGRMSSVAACGLAKRVLEASARRPGQAAEDFFVNALQGINKGLGGVLDVIADYFKQQAAEDYVRSVLDRHVTPMSWEHQVEMIRQLFAVYGSMLGRGIDIHHPERYARDWEPLVRELIHARTRIAQQFRRR